jgi:hypothetical protein
MLQTDSQKIASAEAMHKEYLDALEVVTDKFMNDPTKDLGGIVAAALVTAESLVSFVLDTIDPDAPMAHLGYDAVEEMLHSATDELAISRAISEQKTLTGTAVYRSE